ncbi:MAG: hypothetical protein ACPG4X_14515 [Pikeienuella sp.]
MTSRPRTCRLVINRLTGQPMLLPDREWFEEKTGVTYIAPHVGTINDPAGDQPSDTEPSDA